MLGASTLQQKSSTNRAANLAEQKTKARLHTKLREEKGRWEPLLGCWILTVVPESPSRRWGQTPACRAFVTAAGGLAALRPHVAALLGGSGRDVLPWGSGSHSHPDRGIGHLLPQRLLGCHDLLALGDKGALFAEAELPVALPGVAFHRHHEAVIAAA